MSAWSFDWPEWDHWRRRNYFTPPLWYFHRALAGKKDENVIEEPKSHVLKVQGINWMIKENGLEHRTEKYELVRNDKAPVLRRGRSFVINVRFSNTRSFDDNQDNIRLFLEFGSNPSLMKGTKAVINVSPNKNILDPDYPKTGLDYWSASLKSKKYQSSVEIRVRIPIDAPVGIWRISLLTWYGSEYDFSNKYTERNVPIYVLFNPFHEADMVYLKNSVEREEYVEGETGKIYGGSHNRIKGRPWIYGQYKESVLPAVFHLLSKVAKGLRDTERGDPIRVVRAISAVINANDDSGVLLGRWDGNYIDGTKPYQWTGSVAILEEYMQNLSPVKYGQCWVFAGLVTTVCRSLGIPCRDVTCYLSAHDTNKSFSIDKFYDEEGEEIRENPDSSRFPADSIWNFHVWNEVYMFRAPSEYAGWQVIDATPQEESDGLMRCGPAPVRAVKNGDMRAPYDIDFVFTEVNADVFVFVPDKKSPWNFRLSNTDTDHVGKLLITKKIGQLHDDDDKDYMDITLSYKAREGSISERNAMIRALRMSGGNTTNITLFPGAKNNDVYFKMIDLDKGTYGEPYFASLYVHNQSKKHRTLYVAMSTSSVYYTGTKAHLIKKANGDFSLKPYERETFTLRVEPEEYMPRSVEYCLFMNRFSVNVLETEQTWIGEDDFSLEKPRLRIRINPDTPRVFRNFKMFLSFQNPLETELTRCDVTVEAPGIIDYTRRKFRTILSREKIEIDVALKAWRSGMSTVVATFNSRELYDINGTKKITILT